MSMGGFAARKAVEVVEHVETVIAIEMLAACQVSTHPESRRILPHSRRTLWPQALDLHRPLKTTPPLEALHALVREHVAPWDQDRQMAPDIAAALELVQSGAALDAIESVLNADE